MTRLNLILHPSILHALGALICLSLAQLAADESQDASPPQSPQSQSPSYYTDVRPIFQANCQGCHQPAKASGEYVMTSFAALLKGGESESAAIVPGKPEDSYVVEEITPVDGEAEMPQGRKSLSAVEIETIVNWIRAGAVDDTPEGATTSYDMEHPPTYHSLPIITALDFAPDGTLLAVSGYHEVLLHTADGAQICANMQTLICF